MLISYDRYSAAIPIPWKSGTGIMEAATIFGAAASCALRNSWTGAIGLRLKEPEHAEGKRLQGRNPLKCRNFQNRFLKPGGGACESVSGQNGWIFLGFNAEHFELCATQKKRSMPCKKLKS